MRLLYITESVPNRDPVRGDGSSMIPFEVIRHLPDDVTVTLLTFAGPVDLPDEIGARCEAVHILPTRQHLVSLTKSVLSRHDVGTQERATERAIQHAHALSAACDAALVHGPHVLFLAPHIAAPLVLQTVDPWSIRIKMEGSLTSGWKALYRAHKSRKLLRAERRLPARARLLTVSARDAADWSDILSRPVRSIPNGADPVATVVGRKNRPAVCFVGSLNYGPNIASAQVLVNKIAPLVWAEVPEARFLVAGRQPSSEVQALAGPRVEVIANVPSVADVFRKARVAAFPDEHGVGIRNSVREALAAGLPVVATPVAAREQEAHALLSVEEDVPAFVRLVVHHLTTDRLPKVGRDGGRTWEEVAGEYVDELQKAVAGQNSRRQAQDSSA